MPIYEYQCAGCGRVMEKWQKISEPPLTVCPACGGSLTKIISSCSFHLKGSGWYVTDYGGSRTGAAGEKTSEEPKAAAGDSGEAQKPKEAEKAPPSAPASSKFK